MAKQVQLRRGTKPANAVFVGASGEVTMDTDSKDLRLHDGATVGGFRVPTLVEVQYPNADNNYTWCRKWSDGWVEQGGYAIAGQYNNGTVITLPVTMANTNYTVLVAPLSQTHWTDSAMYSRNSVSQITIYAGFNGGSGQSAEVSWEVKGMAA